MTEFLFKETPTTEISSYCHTLALHDSLPIDQRCRRVPPDSAHGAGVGVARAEPRRALAACRRGRREGKPRRPHPSSLLSGRRGLRPQRRGRHGAPVRERSEVHRWVTVPAFPRCSLAFQRERGRGVFPTFPPFP